VQQLKGVSGQSSRMVMNYMRMIETSRDAVNGDVEPFLRIAETLPSQANPRLGGFVYANAAYFVLATGQPDDAASWARRCLDMPSGSPGPRAFARAVLAKVALLRGDVDDAVTAASEAVGHAHLAGIWPKAFVLRVQVEALEAAGRGDEARAALKSAVHGARLPTARMNDAPAAGGNGGAGRRNRRLTARRR
jgi:ATP/maltotriose-dependent transcriptional regulator MalT